MFMKRVLTFCSVFQRFFIVNKLGTVNVKITAT